ncbi:MAG: recombinase family protein, partial [Clostridiaceae bacterium]
MFLEYQSGRKADRAQLVRLFERVQPMDTIVNTEVSRITRSTKQLCEIIEGAKRKRLCLMFGSFVDECTKGLDPMKESRISNCMSTEAVFAFPCQFSSLASMKKVPETWTFWRREWDSLLLLPPLALRTARQWSAALPGAGKPSAGRFADPPFESLHLDKKTRSTIWCSLFLAERVGFEPTLPLRGK